MEQPFTHSGTRDPAPSPREQENAALARQAAAAGIVLLKNRGVLPLNPGAPVALFGAGAGRTVKGGTGSGDVNNRASVSIWQGLKEAGVPLTSEDWLADCEARYTRAREDWRAQVLAAAKQVDNPFDAYAARPFALPEGRTIRPQDLKGAKAALYVISRIAGEGKDRRLEPGDYYLSDAETPSGPTCKRWTKAACRWSCSSTPAARWNSPACWTACSISTPFCSFPSSGSRAGRPWPMCCWAALCRRAS